MLLFASYGDGVEVVYGRDNVLDGVAAPMPGRQLAKLSGRRWIWHLGTPALSVWNGGALAACHDISYASCVVKRPCRTRGVFGVGMNGASACA